MAPRLAIRNIEVRLACVLYHNSAMPNIASVLKSEIARLARREIKAEVAPLKKAASQYRSSIAALKRQIQDLERQLRRKTRSARGAEDEADGQEEGGVRRRFRSGGLASHRRKLGLSAEDYGALVGVSGQSIYKWEQGEVRPRAAQLQALAAVRGIGKRQALARLEELAAAAATKPARKRKA
jgi:DNA-binding XRE family transcriptional regulator